jgi:hypothetical protein
MAIAQFHSYTPTQKKTKRMMLNLTSPTNSVSKSQFHNSFQSHQIPLTPQHMPISSPLIPLPPPLISSPRHSLNTPQSPSSVLFPIPSLSTTQIEGERQNLSIQRKSTGIEKTGNTESFGCENSESKICDENEKESREDKSCYWKEGTKSKSTLSSISFGNQTSTFNRNDIISITSLCLPSSPTQSTQPTQPTQINPMQPNIFTQSTQINSTQINPTQINPTQINPTQINPLQPNPIRPHPKQPIQLSQSPITPTLNTPNPPNPSNPPNPPNPPNPLQLSIPSPPLSIASYSKASRAITAHLAQNKKLTKGKHRNRKQFFHNFTSNELKNKMANVKKRPHKIKQQTIPKEKKKRKQWKEEDMERAMEMVLVLGLTGHEASQICHVPHSTLWARLQREKEDPQFEEDVEEEDKDEEEDEDEDD